MPRRKVKYIAATELSCFEQVVAELKDRSDFDGYDLSTLALSVKYQVEPTIRPANLQKAIDNIERYVAINCKEPFDYIVGVSKLAKISKISRPTITRWCADKFIRPETEQVKFSSEQDGLYDLGVVLEQLRAIN